MRSSASPLTTTLVLPQSIADELLAALQNPLETAGVLVACPITTADGSVRLLGRQMHWVPEQDYIRRESTRLSIASTGYVPALAQAESASAIAIWVHTHPGGLLSPMPSSADQIVDSELRELFSLRTGSDSYGALVVAQGERSFTFTGHLEFGADGPVPIDRVWIVGSRFQLIQSYDSSRTEIPAIFDRNVRAFGGAVQQTLSDLHIGIVGCGGTGSIVAEQLVRLGVTRFTLVDPDTLQDSNVTRVYGSTIAAIGSRKVDVIATNLERINPSTVSTRVCSTLNSLDAAKQMETCDVVFGCTDDNAGRLVLSRIATYLLTPVIDCGVILTSDSNDQLLGIDGRVTILAPGEACLLCRNRIDVRRASAELMSTEERKQREREGYAPALGGIEPAVVTYTTMVGATAVSELLERLIGYGPEPRPSEVLLRCHEREISTNAATPRAGHFCDSKAGKLGFGNATPFLELTWPS